MLQDTHICQNCMQPCQPKRDISDTGPERYTTINRTQYDFRPKKSPTPKETILSKPFLKEPVQGYVSLSKAKANLKKNQNRQSPSMKSPMKTEYTNTSARVSQMRQNVVEAQENAIEVVRQKVNDSQSDAQSEY